MTHSLPATARPARAGTGPGAAVTGPATRMARGLLVCGAIAGPLFIIVVLAQAFTRPGFDLARDAASLLDNGPWGWVQATNFIVTGLLFIAAAAGLRRILHTGPGRTWIPRLLVIAGAGMAGGGVFHPDPSNGFPPGTPAQSSAVSSWHGILHEICGSAAFLALIVLCFVLARRYRASQERRMRACALAAGALCAAGVASGGAPHGSLTLFTGVSIALLLIATVTGQLASQQPVPAIRKGKNHD